MVASGEREQGVLLVGPQLNAARPDPAEEEIKRLLSVEGRHVLVQIGEVEGERPLGEGVDFVAIRQRMLRSAGNVLAGALFLLNVLASHVLDIQAQHKHPVHAFLQFLLQGITPGSLFL